MGAKEEYSGNFDVTKPMEGQFTKRQYTAPAKRKPVDTGSFFDDFMRESSNTLAEGRRRSNVDFYNESARKKYNTLLEESRKTMGQAGGLDMSGTIGGKPAGSAKVSRAGSILTSAPSNSLYTK